MTPSRLRSRYARGYAVNRQRVRATAGIAGVRCPADVGKRKAPKRLRVVRP